MEMPRCGVWAARIHAFRAILKPVVPYGGSRRAALSKKSREGKDKVGEGRLITCTREKIAIRGESVVVTVLEPDPRDSLATSAVGHVTIRKPKRVRSTE